MAALVRGTDVIISGLNSRPELNGECGKVISFEDGRYGVKIDRDGGKSEAIRLKPPNVAAREYAAGLKLDANFMPVLQRSSPGQLAWLLGEYGAAEEHARFVEVALLFAAVLAFPDQVGYPSAWDRDGVSNCVAFLRAGGHKAILKIGAAKHLEKNAAVAERCAQVVMGLAMDEVDAAVGSTAALNAAGAPAALAAAIRAHLEVEGVQDAAVKALSSLSASADSEPSASAVFCRTAVLEQGGLEAAVLAAAAHATKPQVALYAARVVGHLAQGSADAAKEAVRVGAVPAMVGAIRASPTDADVAAKCCTALANLFVGGAGADADGDANADNGSGTFNLAGGTTTTVSTQRPSAFVAKVAEAMVLDRVPEVAVGVLQAGHSGVAGQEACEGACALLSNIASMGQPEACRAVGAEMGLNSVLAQYPQESTQTIARRALSALVGSYE